MDEMAKEIEAALRDDFPNAKNLSLKVPQNGTPKQQQATTTVTEVLAVLKAKINADFDALDQGLKRLKESL